VVYKSIFEQLIEEMETKGHKTYRTSFQEDKAAFNLPPEMKLPNKIEFSDETFQGTGGQPRDRSEDKNKQLRLPGSSTIQSAAYWPDKAYLIVSFKSGHTYSYDEVGPWTIQEWEQASSAGSHFYYNIRMSFKYQKMS